MAGFVDRDEFESTPRIETLHPANTFEAQPAMVVVKDLLPRRHDQIIPVLHTDEGDGGAGTSP